MANVCCTEAHLRGRDQGGRAGEVRPRERRAIGQALDASAPRRVLRVREGALDSIGPLSQDEVTAIRLVRRGGKPRDVELATIQRRYNLTPRQSKRIGEELRSIRAALGIKVPRRDKGAAKTWLIEVLSAGPLRKKQVMEMAKDTAFSRTTLERAAKELQVCGHTWNLVNTYKNKPEDDEK